MSWNRASLEEEIQNEVDDFEADSLTVIRQAINDTCRTIWFRHDWSFREGTGYISTDGIAQTFTIASSIANLAKILSVGFKGVGETAYRVIGFVPYERFLQLYNNTTPAVSNPTVWSLFNGQIIFDTIPPAGSSNVQISHVIDFVDLTADADVPLIPEKYKHVIKSGAKATFFDFDDDLRGPAERMRFEGPAYRDGVGGLIGDMISEDNEKKMSPHDSMPMGQRGVIFGRR